MDINDLLRRVVATNASDLHLRVPSPPVLRIDGDLKIQEDLPAISAKDAEGVLEQIATPEQKSAFLRDMELDFAYGIPGVARFRVNVMRQRGTLSICFRVIPTEMATIEELGLPLISKELILKPRGMILVTGPTGSGKSTTMASMLNYLNENSARNVITIENPIEYLHQNRKCLIAQRDLGEDTHSFDTALVHALRHDPDVIVVGEMRDLPTVSTALRAAETGHLVMGTLHTIDAAQTVDRIIDMYPSDQQPQIRLQFSQVVVAVLSQTLLPKMTGKGRVAAFEVMIANTAVRNLIRDGKTYELNNVMQLNSSEGMQTLDQCLAGLVRMKIVTPEEALTHSSHPDRLQKLIQFEYKTKTI
ncbi:MAG: type IV pilus twitching motility protein PilT [Dehalococcoidia bacterium]|nr:MAG: type IV pilus twitching motility protein PilT [Dehalococcoidia bacterium]